MTGSTPPVIRALSIVAPGGQRIADGRKRLEIRSWAPDHLPVLDLLIVENGQYLSEGLPEDPDGRAVALVDVVGVHAWRPEEVEAACATGWAPGYLAWELARVRAVCCGQPVPARLGLYPLEGLPAGLVVLPGQADPGRESPA